jgi:cytochrome c
MGLLVAASGSAAAQTANGKELYRNNCKVCHDKGSPQGQYTPMTLTQDQRRTFFKLKLLSSFGDCAFVMRNAPTFMKLF